VNLIVAACPGLSIAAAAIRNQVEGPARSDVER
jgi:hypothetical protein